MNQVCNYETIQSIQQFARSYIFFSNLQLHMNATRIAIQSTYQHSMLIWTWIKFAIMKPFKAFNNLQGLTFFFPISNFVWMLQMFTWMPQHKDIEIGPLKKFKGKKLTTTSSKSNIEV